MPEIRFVVAVSQKEAEELAGEIGYDTKAAALDHLREVQAPPTDPFYAQKYTVYKVNR